MEDASAKAPPRDTRGRFGPGNPGRPRGARGRMTQRIALSLLRHFEQNEGQILSTLTAYENIPVYMRLIDRMLARSPNEDGLDLDALPVEDATRVTRAVRAALERVEAGEGSLADIEAALDGAVGRGDQPDIR